MLNTIIANVLLLVALVAIGVGLHLLGADPAITALALAATLAAVKVDDARIRRARRRATA